MKETIVNPNFLYPDIPESAFQFGSGQLVGVPLREDGDWRSYTPPEEHQNRNGVESSACYIEAQQHAIATIQEEQFNLPDQNYSARFNAFLSNGTPMGGDPLKGGDSIRHDGLIPDSMLPFADSVQSWEEFHSFEDSDAALCKIAGQKWLDQWQANYDVVFKREEPVEEKYRKLREALKYSPVPISVYAWVEDNGVYIKPPGVRDNHLTEAVYVDEQNRIWVFDTYEPFLKILAPWTNPEFAMRWSLTRLLTLAGPKKSSLLLRLWNWVIGKVAIRK